MNKNLLTLFLIFLMAIMPLGMAGLAAMGDNSSNDHVHLSGDVVSFHDYIIIWVQEVLAPFRKEWEELKKRVAILNGTQIIFNNRLNGLLTKEKELNFKVAALENNTKNSLKVLTIKYIILQQRLKRFNEIQTNMGCGLGNLTARMDILENNIPKSLDVLRSENSVLQDKVNKQEENIHDLNERTSQLEKELILKDLLIKKISDSEIHSSSIESVNYDNHAPISPLVQNGSYNTTLNKDVNDADIMVNETVTNMTDILYEHAPKITVIGIITAILGFLYRRFKKKREKKEGVE